MVRQGRHRLPTPTALLVVVATLLVGSGIAAAMGTASADSRAGRGEVSAERDDDRGRDRGEDSDRGDNRGRDGKGRGDKKDKDSGKDDDRDEDDDDEFPGRDDAGPADDDDYVDITRVRLKDDEPRNEADASTGSFTAKCGRNENNHLNSDNYMVTPGQRNGAQHVHDYVGNLSTDAFSDSGSLHAAGTTCDRGNISTFFWPVLRATNRRGDDVEEDGGGRDGNFGRILRPAQVDLRFRGNPTGKVIPMPDDLMIIMGDAKAKTNGDENANAQWTCTGFENRITERYPLCPSGSKLMRILDFPSCWDGANLDSEDFRSHVVYPRDNGSCRRGFDAVPQLRITLTYDRPDGRNFAVDSFPDQRHDPRTDHSDFENMAPDALLDLAANCINTGKNC